MSDGTLSFVENVMEYDRDDSRIFPPGIVFEPKRAARMVKFSGKNVLRPTFEPQA
ncbi:hypothetical protein [Cyclobacterium plantarum]|uniref:Uncharacterized protein n=1 Tax=Cyclobacterium plantarum TaxID=2716263 RepID=A0ABX0H4T8_9BACT|nr:hypothetical protein [Cyclobacterium plantarum]NHE56649.1 hypothetical protein [Cyclobacterium plantarum]